MNKTISKIVTAVFIFGAVAGGLWAFKNFSASKSLAPHPAVHKKIYRCPMHPQIISDRPGKCPICHMDLAEVVEEEPESHPAAHEHAGGLEKAAAPKEVTLEELMKMKPGEICLLHKCKMGTCLIAVNEEIARLGKCPHCGEDLGLILKEKMPEGYGAVKLLPEKQQMIGVKTAPVKKIHLVKTIRNAGTIAHDPDLYQAQSEYLQSIQAMKKAEQSGVEDILEQSRRLVEASKIRLKHLGLSDELVDEFSKQKEADHSLLFAHTGQPVWVYANVYEYELQLVKTGQDIKVDVPSVEGKIFQGKVRGIDSMVDPNTRTTRIRAVIENSEGFLRPDMYVNVSIDVDLGEVLVIPKEAVFDTGKRQIVFVDKGDGHFEPRELSVGAKTEEYYQVKSGVGEGDRVVTSGNFLIDSESRLKAALQSATGGVHQH